MPTLYDELLRHRDDKKDRRVFGLVLQGGGMRGVYSSSAMVPLAEYGFSDTFEHVIGSSAGALNGTYMMGWGLGSYKFYTNELTNTNFVNLLRKDKKVDVDFAIDTVLKSHHPLDIKRLQQAHTKLHVVLTDARTGKQTVISDHHQFVQIYEELRATAALPLLYDHPVTINGREYIDGAVANSLPIDVALDLGCTDIVFVATQQLSTYQFDRRHTRLINHLIRRFARKQPTAIRNILPTNEKALRRNMRRLTHPSKKIRLYLLEPTDEQILVSLTTIDKPKIAALARMGITDMDAFLHKPL